MCPILLNLLTKPLLLLTSEMIVSKKYLRYLHFQQLNLNLDLFDFDAVFASISSEELFAKLI